MDLLGPGAWGAARSTTSRPAPVGLPNNSGATPDSWAQDCTTPSARDGTEWKSAHMNAMLAQLRRAIRLNAVPESNSDDEMLARAMRSQRMNYYSVGGTANALTLTPAPAFAAATDMIAVPMRFIMGASANTTAVTLNVNGLGVKPVVWPDGTALAAGDLPAGALVEVVYDGANFRVMPSLSPSQITALIIAARKTVALPVLSADAVGATGTSLPNAVDTKIACLTNVVKNSLATSTYASSRVTIGAGEAGLWQVVGSVSIPLCGPSSSVSIRVNGTEQLYSQSPEGNSGDAATPSVSGFVQLAVGDYVELFAYQQTGAAKTVNANNRTRLSMVRLSA